MSTEKTEDDGLYPSILETPTLDLEHLEDPPVDPPALFPTAVCLQILIF